MSAVPASTKRKRDSAPVSPPSEQQALDNDSAEEALQLIAVDGAWATMMISSREAGQFIDVTLIIGGRRVPAHKVVLVSASPFLKGLLTSGLAESNAQNQELALEDMDGGAVEALVDCMYSGKLRLSSRTVTSVIRVANLLQVGAAEKAAGEFFLSQLEPSTAVDALCFAADRAACGEHANALREGCMKYAVEHFVALSRAPSFLSLSAETIADLICSDELRVIGEDYVIGAVRSWIQHDTAGRALSLTVLMPLIRWPLLSAETRRGLCNELLFRRLMELDDASFRLGAKMLLECFDPDLHDESCPRLKHRKNTLPPLGFTVISTECYRTSEDGAMLETIADPDHRPAICLGHVMNSGKSCAEFTIQDSETSSEIRIHLYLTPAMTQEWSMTLACTAAPNGVWIPPTTRLLLDLDAGTLKMKFEGQDVGSMQTPAKPVGTPICTGLTGDLCWAVSVKKKATVRIKALEPEDF